MRSSGAVVLLSALAARHARHRRPRPAPAGGRGADRVRLRAAARLRRRARLRAPAPAARAGRRPDRRRQLRRGRRRPRRRRDRAAGAARSSGCGSGSPRLDRARNEFIANASHELRTPLFSLGGFLELRRRRGAGRGTRREFVEQMREQVDRLTKLATDLLDLSRLDAGRVTVERERLDLVPRRGRRRGRVPACGATGAGTRSRSTPAMPSKRSGTTSACCRSGGSWSTTRSATRPLGTTVRVRARRAGGTAVLAVEDDGPGIPPESARQVFERFYRLGGAVAVGQRARAGDRARARRADGRSDRARVGARQDSVLARARGRARAGAGAGRFRVKTAGRFRAEPAAGGRATVTRPCAPRRSP